jgi:hypothetical protein
MSHTNRLMDINPSGMTDIQQSELVNQLKRQVTFIKYKSNGRSYSRLYYLVLSEDAVDYQGSKRKSNHQACLIKSIVQVRPGFTTNTWKNCLKREKITVNHVNLAFSIIYDNNRKSLDLLAENEQVRSQWIQGLEFLMQRYRSHIRTHREITDQWIWHLFHRADTDHSKYLTRNEIRQLLHTLNIELAEHEIDYYFNQANIRTKTVHDLTCLDKDEFLIFYKYVSQRPELLKIICQYVYTLNNVSSRRLVDR